MPDRDPIDGAVIHRIDQGNGGRIKAGDIVDRPLIKRTAQGDEAGVRKSNIAVCDEADNGVHRDILHGYGSKGDCQLEANVFERRFDLIKWECVRDVLPVTATQGENKP